MQNIGERLEEARKKKGVSIREAAEATKIRGDYLQKFEGCQFDIGLAPIYTRGFLRNYAAFLGLPADRLVEDYSALARGSEARRRQPNREVYGRMELSMTAEEDPAPAAAAAAAPAESNRPLHSIPRSREELPSQPLLDPALVFKGGIALAALVLAGLILWGVKSLFSSSSAAAARAAAPATAAAPAVLPAPTLTLVALDDVRVKVARQSDGTELYQGPLARGERREFPNVPLFVTASAMESIAIDYKGREYPTNQQGYTRVKLDFSRS